jgi:hypothetical protein
MTHMRRAPPRAAGPHATSHRCLPALLQSLAIARTKLNTTGPPPSRDGADRTIDFCSASSGEMLIWIKLRRIAPAAMRYVQSLGWEALFIRRGCGGSIRALSHHFATPERRHWYRGAVRVGFHR